MIVQLYIVVNNSNVFIRMRNIGFCGIDEITNSLGVIEDLEKLAAVEDRVPRDKSNGDLQHSFSADEIFA